ncbi:MAG TPA: EamA family transporter RarD [Nevskiaceae bacterium]|nr:EamA family transporter RarD [Nevskiaceae bacterium]
MSGADADQRRGFIAVFSAFIIWGLFPLYWRWLQEVPAFQISAHRVVWCGVFVVAYLGWRQGRGWFRTALAQPRVPLVLAGSSLLIGINWLVYIYGVNSGQVVETSLGYFINPLVNVLLGVGLLKERLNRAQWTAVALAFLGVAWLTWQLGRLPWIALTLAFSFGTYGLLRKIARVDSIPGLGVESVFLFLPSLAYLIWCEGQGVGSFGHLPVLATALLVFGGVMTAVPLIFFAYGARQIPYSQVGLIQYVGPTLQLLTGVLIFHEPFTTVQGVGFGLIWTGLAIYAADLLRRAR